MRGARFLPAFVRPTRREGVVVWRGAAPRAPLGEFGGGVAAHGWAPCRQLCGRPVALGSSPLRCGSLPTTPSTTTAAGQWVAPLSVRRPRRWPPRRRGCALPGRRAATAAAVGGSGEGARSRAGQRVHSSVVRAADCRSAGPWFKSGCALLRQSLEECRSNLLRQSSTHFDMRSKTSNRK